MKTYDDELYSAVVKELESNIRDEALWLKAFALEDGDGAKTKAHYVRLRVEKLQRLANPQTKDVSSTTILEKKKCPFCGHVRTVGDVGPDYSCPSCGKVYAKFEKDLSLHKQRAENSPTQNLVRDKAPLEASSVARDSSNAAIVTGVVILFLLGYFVAFPIYEKWDVKRKAEQTRVAENIRKQVEREAKAKRESDPVYIAQRESERRESEAKMAAYKANPENFRIDAMLACDNAIRSVLNDPDSAKFNDIRSDAVLAGLLVDSFSIKRGLRAKNFFGGYIKTTYFCSAQVINGVVRVKDVREASR
jgi:rubrerythrin